jgi:acyl carrier protein
MTEAVNEFGELDNRLFRCISSVCPNLTDKDIRELNVSSLVDIDSLAAVTLVALIDDEFGVMLDSESLMKLGNFRAIRQYLWEKTSSACRDEQGPP